MGWEVKVNTTFWSDESSLKPTIRVLSTDIEEQLLVNAKLVDEAFVGDGVRAIEEIFRDNRSIDASIPGS